jgi:hypothetical protein
LLLNTRNARPTKTKKCSTTELSSTRGRNFSEAISLTDVWTENEQRLVDGLINAQSDVDGGHQRQKNLLKRA